MICPHCKKAKLKEIPERYPYSVEYLQCPKCDSTYPIDYKEKCYAMVNKLTGE